MKTEQIDHGCSLKNHETASQCTSLLLVDDDATLCRMLREYLQTEGFHVETRMTAKEGLHAARAGGYDLIILDVMLGQAHGLEVLRELRTKQSTPVIMLTAKGDDVDRIIGLELGADDYLGKPFNPRELVARIRAVLRRAVAKPQEVAPRDGLKAADLEIDLKRRAVTLSGRLFRVTAIEFEILKILAESPGQVVPREELQAKVFHRQMHPLDRTLNVHVANLRRKMERCGHSDRIKTVHGMGYLFVLPP